MDTSELAIVERCIPHFPRIEPGRRLAAEERRAPVPTERWDVDFPGWRSARLAVALQVP